MPNFDPNKSKYIKLVDFFVYSIVASFFLLNLVTTGFFIVWPTAPTLFGSVLPLKWYYFPLIYLFPIYTGTCLNFYIVPVLVAAFVLGTVFIPFTVRELRLGRKKYWANDTLRNPWKLQMIYRNVQIIQHHINLLAGKLLVPFQTVTTLIFVLSGYVVLKHREHMAMAPFIMILSWTGLAPVIWALILTMGGFLHSNGLKILNSWTLFQSDQRLSKFEKRVMAKFKASSKPIMICYGKMFVMRRVSVMVFVRGLSKGLLRALLTFEK